MRCFKVLVLTQFQTWSKLKKKIRLMVSYSPDLFRIVRISNFCIWNAMDASSFLWSLLLKAKQTRCVYNGYGSLLNNNLWPLLINKPLIFTHDYSILIYVIYAVPKIRQNFNEIILFLFKPENVDIKLLKTSIGKCAHKGVSKT